MHNINGIENGRSIKANIVVSEMSIIYLIFVFNVAFNNEVISRRYLLVPGPLGPLAGTLKCHAAGTTRNIPLRHSIQTRSQPAVVLSIFCVEPHWKLQLPKFKSWV